MQLANAFLKIVLSHLVVFSLPFPIFLNRDEGQALQALGGKQA